jgi:hypothetical protein
MAQTGGLSQFGRFELFDEQPIPSLNSEALDFRANSELFCTCQEAGAISIPQLSIR